jgi:chromosome segregation ATPase
MLTYSANFMKSILFALALLMAAGTLSAQSGLSSGNQPGVSAKEKKSKQKAEKQKAMEMKKIDEETAATDEKIKQLEKESEAMEDRHKEMSQLNGKIKKIQKDIEKAEKRMAADIAKGKLSPRDIEAEEEKISKMKIDIEKLRGKMPDQ